MYTVFLKNGNTKTYINGKNTVNRIEGTLTEGKALIPSLEFTIYYDNDGYDKLIPYATKIYAEDDDGMVFFGRVISVSPSMDSNGIFCKEVVAESFLGYFKDSIYVYTQDLQDNCIDGFIKIYVDNHNDMMADYPDKQINFTAYITQDTIEGREYDISISTWEKLIAEDLGYGYQISEDSNGDLHLGTHVDESVSTTYIELGKNLESLSVTDNFDNLCTRVVPLNKDGYSWVDPSLGPWEAPWIDTTSQTALNTYGIVMKAVKFEEISSKSESRLKRYGRKYLQSNEQITRNFKINAIDLYRLGYSPESFQLFRKYRIKCEPLNCDETLQLTKITRDINDEYNTTLEFGDLSYRNSKYKVM